MHTTVLTTRTRRRIADETKMRREAGDADKPGTAPRPVRPHRLPSPMPRTEQITTEASPLSLSDTCSPPPASPCRLVTPACMAMRVISSRYDPRDLRACLQCKYSRALRNRRVVHSARCRLPPRPNDMVCDSHGWSGLQVIICTSSFDSRLNMAEGSVLQLACAAGCSCCAELSRFEPPMRNVPLVPIGSVESPTNWSASLRHLLAPSAPDQQSSTAISLSV